jgi:methyltransferase-like protein/SAM-dependent methyltransferase
MADSPNRYDEVPYDSLPFQQSHPDRLATVAKIFGMQPAPLENCRVLELGCSSGGNLLPIAARFPNSEVVGIDGSQRQVAIGEKLIAASGLKNAQIIHRNILEVGADLGKFDYIITHGVLSWVPRDVQEKILEISSRNLSDQGVSYISYNTMPGWKMRGIIRDAMLYRANLFNRPDDKLRESRALIEFLSNSVPTENNAYGILLKSELKKIDSAPAFYLHHDHLEETNDPIYFHEFITRAKKYQLQYLGEAEYDTMLLSNLPPQVVAGLQKLSTDIIQTEQYMDFVRNRLFRSTLLTHETLTLPRNLNGETLRGLYVGSSAKSQTEGVDPLAPGDVVFRRGNTNLTCSAPIVKAAMLVLSEAWPKLIPFDELLKSSLARLWTGAEGEQPEQDIARQTQVLLPALMRAFFAKMVDASVSPTPFTWTVPERPRVTSVARAYASANQQVANLQHAVSSLSDFEKVLVQFMDGDRDQAALCEAMTGAVQAGRLKVQDSGKTVNDVSVVRQVMAQAVPEGLRRIVSKGLVCVE